MVIFGYLPWFLILTTYIKIQSFKIPQNSITWIKLALSATNTRNYKNELEGQKNIP